MTGSRARARARKPTTPVPAEAERDFAVGVAALAALIRSQAERLTEQGKTAALTMQESRTVANLAQAAKALQSGSLWGARHILTKAKPGGDK